MFSFRWLTVRRARPAPKRPRRRLALEILEDRSVPAVLDPTAPCVDCIDSPPAQQRQVDPGQGPAGLAGLGTFGFGGAQGRAPEFETAVVARGLERPTGIFVRDGVIYFTLVPTPGVSGGNGGRNSVEMLDLASGTRRTLHMGEPEPTNITRSANGTLYWTCTSAGVILSQTPEQAETGEVTLVRSGLSRPVGIALDPSGRNLYWTEVPSPGVRGGTNPNTIHRMNFRTGQEAILHTGAAEPTDLAVDRRGNVFFADRTAGRIVQIRPNGHTQVLLRGLDTPVGLALDHTGRNLYFTEVPTPGVSGSTGGRNQVSVLNLQTRHRTVIDAGDPEPTDVWVDRDGSVYWTCSSAGVIVRATPVHGRR